MKYQEGTPGARRCSIGRQHKNAFEIAAPTPSRVDGQVEGAFNSANALITGAGSEQFTHLRVGVGGVIDN